jgi:hypothetical protein
MSSDVAEDNAASGASVTVSNVMLGCVNVGTVSVVLSFVATYASIMSPDWLVTLIMVTEIEVAAETAAPLPTGVAHVSLAPFWYDKATTAYGVTVKGVPAGFSKFMTGLASEPEVATFQNVRQTTDPMLAADPVTPPSLAVWTAAHPLEVVTAVC